MDQNLRMIEKQAELITRLNKELRDLQNYKEENIKLKRDLAFMKTLDILIGKDDNIKDSFEQMMVMIRMTCSDEFDTLIRSNSTINKYFD